MGGRGCAVPPYARHAMWTRLACRVWADAVGLADGAAAARSSRMLRGVSAGTLSVHTPLLQVHWLLTRQPELFNRAFSRLFSEEIGRASRPSAAAARAAAAQGQAPGQALARFWDRRVVASAAGAGQGPAAANSRCVRRSSCPAPHHLPLLALLLLPLQASTPQADTPGPACPSPNPLTPNPHPQVPGRLPGAAAPGQGRLRRRGGRHQPAGRQAVRGWCCCLGAPPASHCSSACCTLGPLGLPWANRGPRRAARPPRAPAWCAERGRAPGPATSPTTTAATTAAAP
jgi:hypothetical protein